MTFNLLVKVMRRDRLRRGLPLPAGRAFPLVVAKAILDGFGNLKEARDYHKTLRRGDVAFYTVEGYEVSPSALKRAIELVASQKKRSR